METDPLRQAKAALRRDLLTRRDTLPGRDERSRAIHARVTRHAAWQRARVLMTFLGVGSEVDTTPLVRQALAERRTVAIPVVEGNALDLFRLEDLADVVPGRRGLLEPPGGVIPPARRVDPASLDLVVVPGVGFDRSGGRLGYGKGFYDRFLGRALQATWIGIAFDVQVVEAVPMGPADRRIPHLITESGVYPT